MMTKPPLGLATLATIFACLVATVTVATARPYGPGMSCRSLRGLVASQGAVVISTGRHTYDRFVDSGQFCERTQITEAAWIPSADREDCFVGYTCREHTRDWW